MTYAIYNGKLIDEKEAVIPISDKAYFFDFAVYSSLKLIQGKIFFPEFHVDRLLESAEVIDLNHDFQKQEILEMLKQLVLKNNLKDAFLRIILIGDADKNENAKLYIFPLTGVHYYPDKFYRDGVKVITYNGERKFPNSKTKDLLLSFLAYKDAEKENAFEALLIDSQGFIREGTRSNFFAIKGNDLISPPQEKILEGVTKKIIFEICKDKFNLKYEDIPLNKIREHDELFITSTLFNALPINQIDDIKLNSNFEKTKIIQDLFREYYREKCL